MENWNAEDFEAEIARKLEAEHKRRAQRQAEEHMADDIREEIAAIDETAPSEPEAAAESEAPTPATDDGTSEVSESPAPFDAAEPAVDGEAIATTAPPDTEDTSDRSDDGADSETSPPPRADEHPAEISAIMQEESDRQRKHVAFAQAQDEAYGAEEAAADIDESPMPSWLRMTFTVLLLLCGAAGIYIMTAVDYQSYFLDPLCFAETAVCMLTALGLNTDLIYSRFGKGLIMKSAVLMLLVFYCLYAMKVLSLTDLLLHGAGKIDWLHVMRDGMSFRIVTDTVKLGDTGAAACAVFVMPFAFLILLLVKPMRYPGVYYPGMAVLFVAAETMRFIAGTGRISLAQSIICLAGAAVAYAIFLMPPLQYLMRRSGLIGWVRLDDD